MTPANNEVVEQGKDLARMNQRVSMIEVEITDLRKFKAEARDFFSRSDEREEARERDRKEQQERQEGRRDRIHTACLTFLAGSAVAGAGWIGTFIISHLSRH